MKILFVTELYNDCVKIFDSMYFNGEYSYTQLKNIMDDSFFSYFSNGYVLALRRLDIEADYVVYNSKVLQNAWKKENIKDYSGISNEDVLLSQINQYGAAVIFWDIVDADLLDYIKANNNTTRLFIGWTGSAVARSKQWRNLDVVLSCAQESVNYLIQEGGKAEHIHHAFPSEVLSKLSKSSKSDCVSFIGSIVRGKDFHLYRENMLLALSQTATVSIYSPSYFIGVIDILKCLVKRIAYKLLNTSKIGTSYLAGKMCPELPVNIRLKKYLSAPVFGLDMFNVLYNSDIVLNIHADSSPLYASNMRLFETTGVGSCLLTDQKNNINDLFVVDKEIVVYESMEDCVEKIQWLLSHKNVAKEIAKAGQQRCLKDHTYDNRVSVFLQIIEKYL